MESLNQVRENYIILKSKRERVELEVLVIGKEGFKFPEAKSKE
jgi:hypothetical protein